MATFPQQSVNTLIDNRRASSLKTEVSLFIGIEA